VEERLRKLLHAFDHRPEISARLMREMLEKDRDGFLTAAASLLRQTSECRGYRYLIALLAGNNCLAACLRDLSLSMPAALTIARIGIQIDPSLDLSLTRAMAEGAAENGQQNEAQAIRTLEILAEISDGPRLLPLLSNVLQSPNPRIRSKTALVIGRRRQCARWVAQKQQEMDPRVRANAMESLWGIGDESARAVLWEASSDGNNRVAGNALIGLYRLGDTRAIGRTMEMAGHADPGFRATAAWVMGESADSRFAPALGRMLADSDSTVRARAFQSLANVRRRSSVQEQKRGLEAYLWAGRRLPDGGRQLCVAIVDRNGRLPEIAATHFLITEGDQMVMDYEVRRRAERLPAIGFGLPRILEAASDAIQRTIYECLHYRQPRQSVAIVRYSLEQPEPESQASVRLPLFSMNSAVISRIVQQRVLRSESADGLAGAARLLVESAMRISGERHLVLVGLPESSAAPAPDLDQLGQTARANGIAIHGLAIGDRDIEVLHALSSATGGRLLRAHNEQETQTALRRIFWGLQYQDELYYRPADGADGRTPVRLQICSDLGMAEDSLALE
jgi:HEAT repeat protein